MPGGEGRGRGRGARSPVEAPRELRDLQAWLQAEIVRPVEGGPARAAPAEAVVTRSATLTAEERVDLYRDSYYLRLRGCLEADFPGVKALLGEAGFDRLARGYLARFPSRDWSLNPLGWDLPRYLADPGSDLDALAAAARPAQSEPPSKEAPAAPPPARGGDRRGRRVRAAPGAPGIDPRLVREVATLEAAVSRLFDAEPPAPMDRAALAAIPAAAWPGARVRLIAPLEIFAFGFRANEVHTAARRGAPLPSLAPSPTWCAVYRSGYTVWRVDLPEARWALLEALAGGAPLAEALERAAERWGDGPDGPDGHDLAGQVFRWLEDWVRDGLFAGVDVPVDEA